MIQKVGDVSALKRLNSFMRRADRDKTLDVRTGQLAAKVFQSKVRYGKDVRTRNYSHFKSSERTRSTAALFHKRKESEES